MRSQARRCRRARIPISVGAPPPPPLTLLPPAVAITRNATVDLTAVAPANLRPDQHYEVRVFVNGNPIGRMDLPDKTPFTVANVPLDEGQNAVQTTLVGDGGESTKSTPVTVSRDDRATNDHRPAADRSGLHGHDDAAGQDRARRRHADH